MASLRDDDDGDDDADDGVGSKRRTGWMVVEMSGWASLWPR